jgi:hypothetical protein
MLISKIVGLIVEVTFDETREGADARLSYLLQGEARVEWMRRPGWCG